MTTTPQLLRAAVFPNPHGQAFPGAGGLLTLLNYGLWTFSVVCVLGILLAAGKMVLSHHRGEPVGMGLGIVLVAAILGTSAAPILTAVTTGHG